MLTRKRAVLRDSITVVRHTVRALRHSRLLLGTVGGTIALTAVALLAWRQFSPDGTSASRSIAHSVVVGVRFLAVISMQFLVATWLFATFLGDTPPRFRQLLNSLARRLPEFAVCAALLAWCEHASDATTSSAIARMAVSFGFNYVLSYAIPAAAVYDTGIVHAFRGAYRALRSTFGADILAWSGVWIVNGAISLVGAIPDALDIYQPGADGSRYSLAGRLFNWLVLMPTGVAAQAIGAAFVTVIFFALERNTAPAHFPKGAVETVSGLHLDD